MDVIWEAYHEDRRDLHAAVATLLEHDDPVVREEALSLLLVKWVDVRYRARAAIALIDDADFGVRGRAAIGLASVSSAETRKEDIKLLLRTLRDEEEEVETRRASYEALLIITESEHFPIHRRDFDPKKDVDWHWVSQLE